MSTLISTPLRLKQALIASLDPQGEVASVFVGELRRALPWMEKEAAQKTAADILFRRRGEQSAHFQEEPLLPTAPGLPPGKTEEMIEWMVQPKHAKTPSADALIHIYANLHAQYDLHLALATLVFREDGPLEKALAQSMARYQPMVEFSNIQNTAREFIHVRRIRAEEVTDALRPGGPIETESIALATRLRRLSDADVKHPSHSKDPKLGEDIAFGVQQTIACWATDFIDPYIGKWFQDKFKHHQHHGTLAHTWAGEIVGDTAAVFSFLGVRLFFPQSIEWMKHSARYLGDGLYTNLGKKSLRGWAAKHHVGMNSAVFQKKLEEWKDFQAENIAKSSVIAVSSVVFNVLTQKTIGNTHTIPVITAGKLVGAATTMATMLGFRAFLPDATQKLDDELNERYFDPLITKIQRWFGTGSTPPHETRGPHTRKLKEQSRPITQALV